MTDPRHYNPAPIRSGTKAQSVSDPIRPKKIKIRLRSESGPCSSL